MSEYHDKAKTVFQSNNLSRVGIPWESVQIFFKNKPKYGSLKIIEIFTFRGLVKFEGRIKT
jgi:hypothetical protein